MTRPSTADIDDISELDSRRPYDWICHMYAQCPLELPGIRYLSTKLAIGRFESLPEFRGRKTCSLTTLAGIMNLGLALAIAYSVGSKTLIPTAGQAPVLEGKRRAHETSLLPRLKAKSTASVGSQRLGTLVGDVSKDIVTASAVFVSIHYLQARR